MSTAQTPPSISEFPVLWPVPTRWDDNDHYGHVNNVTYYSYFDTAVNAWLMSSTGTDIRTLPAIGVVAETSCRYLSELSFPEQLQVGISVEKLGTKSIVYALAIFHEVDGGNWEPLPPAALSTSTSTPTPVSRWRSRRPSDRQPGS